MKAYTSILQSKQLAEILPLETADMFYDGVQDLYKEKVYNIPINGSSIAVRTGHSITKKAIKANLLLPCWSLAALLQIIPKGNYKDFSLNYGGFQADKYIDEWFCRYQQTEPVIMLETHADNPVDASCKMVLKLHELNLI